MEAQLKQIIAQLHELADPQVIVEKDRKFGVKMKDALGIYIKDLNEIARGTGKNDELALALFDSGIYEGKILCSKLFRSASVTDELMEEWVTHFDNWEICDSFSMKLFSGSKHVLEKIESWTRSEEEFRKRAGFVMIATYGSSHKKAPNEDLEQFFPILIREAHDNRIYVKKAVNWALREIGKRNIDLNRKAIAIANELLQRPEKSAQWIAKDALRELEKSDLPLRGFPRPPYERGKRELYL